MGGLKNIRDLSFIKDYTKLDFIFDFFRNISPGSPPGL